MFNKNRKIHFTNQMYKEICPLVDIPTYSERDIDAEYSELSSEYKKYKKQLTLKRCLHFFIFFNIQIFLNLIVMKNFVSFENFNFIVKVSQNLVQYKINFVDFFFYFNAIALCVFILMTELYIYAGNIKPSKPALDKAEFSLRMKLTQPQLKNASHEKVQQIWMYCNSALTKPIKIKV